MNSVVLEKIKEVMANLNINYEFVNYSAKVSYPYFVGEYMENVANDESGKSDGEFLLTGWTRNSWEELEQAKDKIRKVFNQVSSYTLVNNDNVGVAISYDNSLIVPQDDGQLKCIQINLNVKTWEVM